MTHKTISCRIGGAATRASEDVPTSLRVSGALFKLSLLTRPNLLPLIEANPGKARLTLEVETGAETRKARTVFAAPGVGLVVKHDEPGFASMWVNSGTALGGLDRMVHSSWP